MDARVERWLARDPDPETRRALEEAVARGDQTEIERAFAGRLEFGTAGLRGILGVGPARMNRLVVRETTAGLAVYLGEQVPDAKRRGVVVGHDARRGSRLFAEDAASMLAALGFRAHLFSREGPTPLCAYAVRQLHAAAGIMVTASHNPPEYNGYKVYWENGAQIIPPHDAGIAAAIDEAARQALPWCELSVARGRGLVTDLGEEHEEAYLAGVAALSTHARTPKRSGLAIAYTPLHGVGARLAEAALRRAGFCDLHSVPSQREPDGNFPTVRFPNPEEPGAMDAVIGLAAEIGAPLACANDPDADRLAVAVRRRDGSYRMLTGNEVGVLLGWDRMQRAPANGLVVTTIVSSRLLGVMAGAQGLAYAETLTGFKWIANEGLAREGKGEQFLFGYEEALGYTIGGLVRDKDGISALVCFAEMAADCAEQGESVLDRLATLARRFGLYQTAQKSLALDPQRAASVGDRLRATPPRSIAGRPVEAVDDLLLGRRTFADGRAEVLRLPPSDVLVYALADEARVVVRPSGTEPKLKCYYEMRHSVSAGEEFDAAEARGAQALARVIEAHQRELAAFLA
jgi:phosphomannomutase